MSVDRCSRTLNIGPYRQTHAPKVFCVIDRNAIAHSARDILSRMKSNEASRGCGSYLYVEANGSAYIVSDDAAIALDWIKSHFAWLVGFYTKFGNAHKGLAPTLAGIVEDLQDHFDGFNRQQTGAANSLQPATDDAALQRSKAAATAEGDISASGGGAFQGDDHE